MNSSAYLVKVISVCSRRWFSCGLLLNCFEMGKQFGNLAKVRGIVQYSLSPFEQRAFAGAISKGLPNIWRRFTESVFKVVPPFVAAYLIIDYGEKKNKELARKNPADYVNDQ